MANLNALQERRKHLEKQIHDLSAKQKTWTAEDRQVWAKVNAAYDENLETIKTEQKIQAEAKKLAAQGSRFGPRTQEYLSDQAMALQAFLMHGTDLENDITEDHRNAARRVRVSISGNRFAIKLGGTAEFAARQAAYVPGRPQMALSGQDPKKGGVLVGATLIETLEAAVLDYSGVLQACDVVRTDTGEPISFPTIDDTTNTAQLVGENVAATDATDIATDACRLTSFDFNSGMIQVPRSLLRDAAMFNLESELGKLLGVRIGRKQNSVYTTGAGGGLSPAGIVTRSYLGVTAASTSGFNWDEIISLEYSIDPGLRNSPTVGYMMHDNMVLLARKLKNGEGEPIWQSGWNTGAPDRINNRPFWMNQSMASSVTSGAKSMLFGQMKNFKVRQVGEVIIQRLVERAAEKNADIFLAYASGDSNLLDAGDHPIRHMVH